jgi:hypothetical protein
MGGPLEPFCRMTKRRPRETTVSWANGIMGNMIACMLACAHGVGGEALHRIRFVQTDACGEPTVHAPRHCCASGKRNQATGSKTT